MGWGGLRGPATILFISCDACGDSIAKIFCLSCLFSWRIAQIIARYVATCVWHRCVWVKLSYFACSPEKNCEYFFVFAWEFCIEKWRGFLVNFFWSPFPTKRSTKSPRKIRGKVGAKFEAKLGTKIRKIREIFVLQLS